MKTKVLVTGADGQLGQTLKALHSAHSEIDFTFTTKSELDITNPSLIDAFFSKHQFNYCINCAAYTNVEQAEDTPEIAFKINAEAVKNLALASKNNDTILIHISTDYVFDGSNKKPYTENDITNPINEYGKSKLAGENHIREICQQYFIIRTSWLYSVYGKNFIKTIISKIEDEADLSITTSQTGTPTSCMGLSKFIFQLIISKYAEFGIYHYSALGETTWYGFALQISRHFKKYNFNKITPVSNFNSKAIRPNYSVLDNTKALSVLKKQFPWEKSVDQTVNFIIKSK